MISTRSLSLQHPGGPTLTFPDLEVPQGGVLLLKGPSGSGKSTWLALAAGLLTPTSGSLVVADTRLAEMSVAQRDAWRGKAIGFLPQRLHLSEALDVGQNLALVFFAAGQTEDPARVSSLLEALGIAGLARRKLHQVSGGQAQRVALARAILLRPRVLLADEPTASLDDASAVAAVALLVDAAARVGATLVVATHDSRVRSALATSIVVDLAPTRDEVA